MKQRFLLLLIACLTIQQCLLAAAGAGGSPARPLRTPTRSGTGTPPGGHRRTPPSTISTNEQYKYYPTPAQIRKIKTNVRKNLLKADRINITDNDGCMTALDAAAALENSIDTSTLAATDLVRYGALIVSNRVASRHPHNLRPFINGKRRDDAAAYGGNGTSLKKGTKNVFFHTLPLSLIVHLIKAGKTYTYDDEYGRPLIVVVADARSVSNDKQIKAWLSKVDEAQITIGYPPASAETTDPFVIYHAMLQDSASTGKPVMTEVTGVTAYLTPGDPVLRFHIPPTP
mgnify:CR=1 FL=1